MKKSFDTIYGNITLRNVMFENCNNDTVLEEGIEVSHEDGITFIIPTYRNIKDISLEEVCEMYETML